jgi:hypothetical protein
MKISALTAGALFMAGSSSAPEFFTAFSGVVFYKILENGIGSNTFDLTICLAAVLVQIMTLAA